MTNEEALNLLPQLRHIESAFFGVDPEKTGVDFKFDISKIRLSDQFLYALQKNIQNFTRVEKQQKSMFDTLLKIFKKRENVDEEKLKDKAYLDEINAKYEAFLSAEDQVKTKEKFYTSEIAFPIYFFEKEVMDKAVLPVDFKTIFAPLVEKGEEEEEEGGEEEVEEAEETEEKEVTNKTKRAKKG